jgi:hypothetical protein
VRERRKLGFTARRARDAELNRRRRAWLLAFLTRLSRQDLLLWIDGMWLGNATDAQLVALAAAAATSEPSDLPPT